MPHMRYRLRTLLAWLGIGTGGVEPQDLPPPISKDDLLALFEYLNRTNPPPCTHTFSETTAFLRDHSLPVESTTVWLTQNGAFCDCEVIYNTADKWGDWAGFAPTDDPAS